MDREAIARARRREQALDHLAFEREREEALLDQLHEIVTEQLGPEVDNAAFAAMAPDDVEIVRAGLGGGEADFAEETEEEFARWDEEAERDEPESEITRLEEELADCRRRQRAFEHYAEALGHVRGSDPRT